MILLLGLGIDESVSAQIKSAVDRREYAIEKQTRLHEWLSKNLVADVERDDISLAWLSKRQEAEDLEQISRLRNLLLERSRTAAFDPLGAQRLLRLLDRLPYLGRIPLPNADSRWLEVNPEFNPVLMPGDRIIDFKRSDSVTVVLESGKICSVIFSAGKSADRYVDTCRDFGQSPGDQIEIARSHKAKIWIGQPDGVTLKIGDLEDLAQTRAEPAPGAWIWAPTSDFFSDPKFSASFVALLAAQGPAGEYLGAVFFEKTSEKHLITTDLPISRSVWGATGLIQMPTARMAREGTVAVSRTVSDPYRRLNVFIQPLPWMEMGLRYTDIRNKSNGSTAADTNKTYTDKSIDLKIRLMKEGGFLPELSVGWIDAGGTGLFSSEYLVASKRFGDFDLSTGLAFGYLGSRGNLSNPLSLLGARFDTRQSYGRSAGAEPGLKSWFTGAMSPFLGLQWQSPSSKWLLKTEYSSNNQSAEPYLDNDFYTIRPPSSSINIGVVYRWSDWVDLSFGLERGNQLGFGMTFHSDLNRKPIPKILDKPVPKIRLIDSASRSSVDGLRWNDLRQAIEQATQWRVESISLSETTLHVRFLTTPGLYAADRIELIARLLDHYLSPYIKNFVIEISQSGLSISAVEIDRNQFVRERTSLISVSEKQKNPSISEKAPVDPAGSPQSVWKALGPLGPAKFFGGGVTGGLGLAYEQLLGGPSGFWLYELGVRGQAEWRPRSDFWVQATAKYRAFDNYELYPDQTPSQLPTVRTLFKFYNTSNRLTLPNLQATHVGQPLGSSSNHYYSIYGGMLEYMYGGYGFEYLYRPWKSKLSVGFDLNRVQQRDFDQDFEFRSLRSTTGHLTAYWDTGWKDILVVGKAGQYLAGDRGFTLQMSRVFQSGLVFGGYFTRTNVSAEQFGEGSFDKVLYVQIPFDLILPKRSGSTATFGWRNLTRDGGAILNRSNPLFDLTSKRDRRSMIYGTQ